MRRLAFALAGVVVAATLQCNALIGVEDVKLASTKDAGKKDPNASPSEDPPADTPTTQPTSTAPPAPSTCNGAAACKRTLFVTRAKYRGNFGGALGADAKCNDAAKAVPALAGKKFMAWVSDADNVARSRLPQGTDAYVRTDKGVIATSFADLTDGSLASAIELDEKGTALPATDNLVWTGTTSSGLAAQYNCNNWTSDGILDPVLDTGLVGDALAKTAEWSGTDSTTSSCNGEFHLFCVEF